MKAIRPVVVAILAVALLGAAANAQETNPPAKVSMVAGDVMVKRPADSAFVPATVGMDLPEGTTIQTGETGKAFVEVQPGISAAVDKNTSVTVDKLSVSADGKRHALLNLAKGNVISTLDPTRKAVTDYGVKTPKGVAAARGTVFGVSVQIEGTTVATLSGTVTITFDNGQTLSIPVGTASTNSAAAAKLADAVKNPATAQAVRDAVAAVSALVKSSSSATGSADTSTALLAAVVGAASSALPGEAAAFTQTAIAAATSSASSTKGSAVALNAITEAAVRANPGDAANIAKAATTAITQTKVTEAVNSAKASGGDTAAALQQASQQANALNQQVTQTTISTTNALGTAVTPQAIASAATDGQAQGAAQAGTATGTSTNLLPVITATSSSTTQTTSTQVTPITQKVDITNISPGS